MPHLDGRQILADITSVKMQPLGQMEPGLRRAGSGYASPFSAPNRSRPTSASALRRALRRRIRISALWRGFLKDMGCSTFRSTAEAHDSAAASIQGLNFISSLAYFATLAEHEELLPFITPSFRRRLEASRKLPDRGRPLVRVAF